MRLLLSECLLFLDLVVPDQADVLIIFPICIDYLLIMNYFFVVACDLMCRFDDSQHRGVQKSQIFVDFHDIFEAALDLQE